ncbi:MAG: hypothetical protein XD69_0168 [Clostridia bacterium 62_21]|nr:MAG: hypothetical protein XD69_0168 [Clostridia bacterium 62_21]
MHIRRPEAAPRSPCTISVAFFSRPGKVMLEKRGDEIKGHCARIRLGGGTQFDPDLVEVFLNVDPEAWAFLRRQASSTRFFTAIIRLAKIHFEEPSSGNAGPNLFYRPAKKRLKGIDIIILFEQARGGRPGCTGLSCDPPGTPQGVPGGTGRPGNTGPSDFKVPHQAA